MRGGEYTKANTAASKTTASNQRARAGGEIEVPAAPNGAVVAAPWEAAAKEHGRDVLVVYGGRGWVGFMTQHVTGSHIFNKCPEKSATLSTCRRDTKTYWQHVQHSVPALDDDSRWILWHIGGGIVLLPTFLNTSIFQCPISNLVWILDFPIHHKSLPIAQNLSNRQSFI